MGVPVTLSSVPAQTPYVQYVASAGQTVFPYPFEITQDSDLVCLINSVQQATDSGYTLSGQGATGGGNLTFTVGQTAGTIVTLYRNISIARITQLSQNGTFFSANFNNEYNRIYLIMQQIAQSLQGGNQAYALMVPNTNNPAPVTVLTPANYAGKYLSFDSNGNPIPAALTSSGSLTATIIASLLNATTATVNVTATTTPQTVAESAASIVPTATQFAEGDIRRYGALTSASDNGIAINNALTVSSAGGPAAYIPPGSWKHTTQITPAANSSMRGAGSSSVLLPQSTSVNAIEFQPGQFYGTSNGVARYFRDFVIQGASATTSTSTAISVNFTNVSGNRVIANFDNVSIINFNKAYYLRNAWNCTITNSLIYNCYYGLYFFGQSAKTSVRGCSFLRGTITGSGGAWGVSFQATSGENPQNIEITHTDFFGYDIGCNAVQQLLVQIDNSSFSSCQSVGVSVTTTLGGFWLTDSWVEMQNSSATTGVQVAAIGSVNDEDIHITGNHIINDNPFAGSVGVNVVNAQIGVIVSDNLISNFDIGVVNNSSNFTCKFNRIGVVTSVYTVSSLAIQINNNPADNEIGPNLIIPGALAAATCSNSSANIGVPNSVLFPAGTPVQFDATQNGFTAGVTYYVLSSGSNTLTLAPVVSGTAIVATGGTAVNIFPAPLPITLVNGATGLNFYHRGAFIATVGGYASNILAPVCWTANGKSVTLAVTSTITGTSAAASLSWTGTPAFLAPLTLKQMLAIVTNNGSIQYGYAQLAASTGAVAFGLAPSTLAGFTSTGTKAINFQELTYTLT